eukprot:COSAG01_NODE_1468_length_10210_cov_44.350806_5_plen_705_part_00
MYGCCRWLNGYFTRATTELTLEFATEKDGTPRMLRQKSAQTNAPAPGPRGRRGSLFGGANSAHALMASQAGMGNTMFMVQVGGKSVQLAVGTIGVQLVTLQKRGSPMTATLVYGNILEVKPDEAGPALTIFMKDGTCTVCLADSASMRDEICLEVLIMMEEMRSAHQREQTKKISEAFEDSSNEEASDETSSDEGEDDDSSAGVGLRVDGASSQSGGSSPLARTKRSQVAVSFDDVVQVSTDDDQQPARAMRAHRRVDLEPEPEPDQPSSRSRPRRHPPVVSALKTSTSAAAGTEKRRRQQRLAELQERATAQGFSESEIAAALDGGPAAGAVGRLTALLHSPPAAGSSNEEAIPAAARSSTADDEMGLLRQMAEMTRERMTLQNKTTKLEQRVEAEELRRVRAEQGRKKAEDQLRRQSGVDIKAMEQQLLRERQRADDAMLEIEEEKSLNEAQVGELEEQINLLEADNRVLREITSRPAPHDSGGGDSQGTTNRELVAAQKECASLRSQLTEAGNDTVALQQRVAEQTAEMEELRSKLRQSVAASAEQQERADAATAEVTRLSAQLRQAQADTAAAAAGRPNPAQVELGAVAEEGTPPSPPPSPKKRSPRGAAPAEDAAAGDETDDDGPTLQQLTKMIADAKRREKESKGNPALAHAAYDGAVKMALSYLSFHPDQRARLKPILSEIVQRAKRLKLEATEGAL